MERLHSFGYSSKDAFCVFHFVVFELGFDIIHAAGWKRLGTRPVTSSHDKIICLVVEEQVKRSNETDRKRQADGQTDARLLLLTFQALLRLSKCVLSACLPVCLSVPQVMKGEVIRSSESTLYFVSIALFVFDLL